MKIKTILSLVAVAVLLSACENGRVGSVVLITVDGLSVKDAEAFQSIGAEAAIFDDAITPSPSTLPATVSLFTGTNPLNHGVMANDNWLLEESAVTMAEAFQTNKWRTAAFVGASNLGFGTGLEQGFDVFKFNFESAPVGPFGSPKFESAASITDEAVKWLNLFGDKPFFMWAHYGDLVEDWAGAISDEDKNKRLQNVVSAVDNLIRSLPRKGAETIVILTAPATNANGKHNETGHGTFVYNSTICVPLLFKGPSIKKGRLGAPASLEDVLPTVAGLMAFPKIKYAKGADLTSTLRSGKGSDTERERVVVSMEPFYRWGYSPLTALLKGKYKLIVSLGAPPELFDVSADAQEDNNIAASNPGVTQETQARLKEIEKTLTNEKPPAKYLMTAIKPGGAEPAPMEKISSLRSFQEAVRLYDGKDEKGAYRVLSEAAASDPLNKQIAVALALTARDVLSNEEQVALWENAVKLNPGDPLVVVSLAEAKYNAGNSAEALKLLEDALSTDSYNPEAHMLAADILEENAAKLSGRAKREVLEKALKHLIMVMRTDESNALAYYKSGVILGDMADVTEKLPPAPSSDDGEKTDNSKEVSSMRNAAKKVLEQAIGLDPKFADGYFVLGNLLIKLGDKATAKKKLEEYLKLAPQSPKSEEAKRLIKTL